VRIIGGIAGGRLFAAPKGLAVRPTPDLVRQAIFNSLGAVVADAEVLDLFSGSGALGLECLSRGAGRVLSVERSTRHGRYIRENLLALGLPSARHELRIQDAFTALRQLNEAGETFDLIVADPPFGPKTRGEESQSLSQQLLDTPETGQLLRPGGLLVLGHARRDGIAVRAGWREIKRLSHGDSIFRILTVASEAPCQEGGTRPLPTERLA
jgi:16S rRNA (guanine966-N2)-methyltransferase